MNNSKSFLTPIFIVFAVVNIIAFVLKSQLLAIGVQYTVAIIANCIIALLTCIIVLQHKVASTNKNPHVFSRSVMGGTFLKLMVLGSLTVIYLLVAKQNRNIGGIIAGMVLYIIYTFIEVRISLQLNKK